MAEVIHRYVGDPEAKRGLGRRGMVALRREQTAHERAKRLQREMQMAVERGELIRKDLVQQQAAFLLTAMRQRCMSAPSAWSRRILNISDPRVAVERLKEMMVSVLEEVAELPARVTDPNWVGEGDATLSRRMTDNGDGTAA